MTTLALPSIEALSDTAAELAHFAHEAGDRANENALNKAIFHLQSGIEVIPTTGGFLIPSGTRSGVIHRVSNAYGCNCEAGTKGRPCWHQAVIELIEVTQQRTYTTYEDAAVALEECFA